MLVTWVTTLAEVRATRAAHVQARRARLSYPCYVTAAYDNSDLHELIDRLEPDQAEELRKHALRLVKRAGGRFKVLRSFDGPQTDLGASARDLIRTDLG
jgi:hypothetical protein